MANTNRKYLSNVVLQKDMRAVQSTVLQDLAGVLLNSFGPMGSNTCIKELNALNMYTKDGFTILKHMNFNGIIEQSIKDDIESITKNVVTTVGDGTTSAVLLANFIFKGLLEYLKINPNIRPSEVLTLLNECCEDIKKEITSTAIEADFDKLYDIAYTSANGNKWIANTIIDIYKNLGMGVFIDVSPSLNSQTSIKYFDGMTLNTGFSDTCFVTDTRNNSCVVDNPYIFFFEDPVDNKEMGVLFDAIMSRYITTPIENSQMNSVHPLVIVCPQISRDMSSCIDRVMTWQSQQSAGNKIPFLLITDTHQTSAIQDLIKMCGAKPIRKYIDREMYEKDVESGIAPTPFTIHEYAGKADQVVSNASRSKFINPRCMKNPDGTFTNEYNSLLDYIKAEIERLTVDGEVGQVGVMKRRLHSLESNLVEINVGGISVADRDSNRHLFEDAVLNCRSAAKHGIGWGANFSGYLAINKILDHDKDLIASGATFDRHSKHKNAIITIMHNAYTDLIKTLYKTSMDAVDAEALFAMSVDRKEPFNLRSGEFDEAVRSSIESDCIILSSVAKIIGIMVTCNQFIVPTPQHNIYSDLKEVLNDE